MSFARASYFVVALGFLLAPSPLFAQEKEAVEKDAVRKRLADMDTWVCALANTHLLKTDGAKKEKTVRDACLLTVACTKKEDEKKTVWPALLVIAAAEKGKCPTVKEWVDLRLTREDWETKHAPMTAKYEFTTGAERNRAVDTLKDYGESCKYEFAPPYVVWRRHLEGEKKYDRVCINLVTCEKNAKDRDPLIPIACAVADDNGCPSLNDCITKKLSLELVKPDAKK